MIQDALLLWQSGEYTYPMAFGFVPNLHTYVHDEDERYRPAIVIVPGGAYSSVSPTEGEIVALEFYHKGYNAFVLSYTTDLTLSAPLKTQPLRDLSRAIRMIRKEADRYHIISDQIAVCGFSAGGHLCGSLAVHYEDVRDADARYTAISNRPDAAILCYPLITSGDKGHNMCIVALFGKDASDDELEYISLEKHVKETTPPIFIWHTATDQMVPVENSFLFTEACKAKGIPYEQHIFSSGPHGLSLANEQWACGRFGIHYTLEQALRIVDRAKAGAVHLPPEIIGYFTNLENGGGFGDAKPEPNQSVSVWPVLADLWLKRLIETQVISR